MLGTAWSSVKTSSSDSLDHVWCVLLTQDFLLLSRCLCGVSLPYRGLYGWLVVSDLCLHLIQLVSVRPYGLLYKVKACSVGHRVLVRQRRVSSVFRQRVIGVFLCSVEGLSGVDCCILSLSGSYGG